MFLTDRKCEILAALRHGPLDQFQIAADLGIAAFTARAELKGLRRDRLVRIRITATEVVWELTDRGWTALTTGDQLRFA